MLTEPTGGGEQRVQVLGQPHVSRVHHHEGVGEPVGEREGVPLGTGNDGGAVGPVVDHHDLGRIGALLRHEPVPHGLAHRDDAVRLPDDKTVDPLQEPIHGVAAKVLHEPGYLGKDVLA